MPLLTKSKLTSLDAFSRAQDDVRIRTRSGAIVTISCLCITLLLLISEWTQFHQIVTRPELVIDRERNLPLEFSIDITFPNMPCDLLNFDIMDDMGTTLLLDDHFQDSGFVKTRISNMGQELGTYESRLSDNVVSREIQDKSKYCGSCYGARDQSANENLKDPNDWICCQTCHDVQSAYRVAGWAFFDGKNIEQCEREGYVASINEHLSEGCRLKGGAQLERISGDIHFAPGTAFQNMRGHFHDTSLYDQLDNMNLNFNHIIHHLSFGPRIDHNHKALIQNENHNIMSVSTAPLDGTQVLADYNSHNYQFNYFIKIVPTRYEYLRLTEKIINKIIETAQFSSSFHAKPIAGGTDLADPTITHQRGGTPGLYFNIEMSPLKVIQREQHKISWSGFLLNCITSIGGILAVGTVCDKILYRAQRTLFTKKE
ncbi:ER-derived vesicles protein Erv46p [Monosporozyma unispora]